MTELERLVGIKLQEVRSVKDFGAVGDGVTDDTAAIQAAINEATRAQPSNPFPLYQAVYLPAGTYKVTKLYVPLGNGALFTNFTFRGDGRRATTIQKIGSDTAPILHIYHPDQPAEAQVDVSDLAFKGVDTNRTYNGIRLENIANFSLTRLMIDYFAIGVELKSSLVGSIEDCSVSRGGTGILATKTPTGSYVNAITIRETRIKGNSGWGVDFGFGSNLRLRDCDIELNGTSGNLNSGGVIFRSSMKQETSFALALLQGCWFESNKGRSLSIEDFSSGVLHLQIQATNFLTSEAGRAIYCIGTGQNISIDGCFAPATGDTFDLTCSRLSLKSSSVFTIAGSRQYEIIENVTFTSGFVEGTFQRGFSFGGGSGLTFSWSGGGGAYKIAPDVNSGDLVISKPGGGSQVLAVNLGNSTRLVLGGSQVLQTRLPAIANHPSDQKVNEILAMLRLHGLIAT